MHPLIDWPYWRPHLALVRRGLWIGLAASSSMIAILELVGLSTIVLFLQRYLPKGSEPTRLDEIAAGIGLDQLIRNDAVLFAILLFALAAKFICWLIHNRLSAQAQSVVVQSVRAEAINKLFRLSPIYIIHRKTSDIFYIIAAYTYQTGLSINIVISTAPRFVGLLALGLMSLIALPWLTLAAGVVLILAILISRTMHGALGRATEAQTLAAEAFNRELNQSIHGLRTAQAYGLAPSLEENLNVLTQKTNRETERRFIINNIIPTTVEAISHITLAFMIGGVLLFGPSDDSRAALAADGILFVVLLGRMLPFAQLIQSSRASLISMQPTIARVKEMAQLSGEAVLPAGGSEMPDFRHEVRFNGVSVRYSGEQRDALLRVDFSIPKGARIGVVGESGSGKSTFLSALLGFVRPSEGSITVDGVDLHALNLSAWRQNIGLVDQIPYLFDRSPLETIRANRAQIDLPRVESALDMVNARTFVERLPEGINTPLGEASGLLSGGERQRLAIARAIAANPPILLFDEATSALDGENELAVLRTIHAVSAERTVIIVAHRLKMVIDCDLIVFFKAGEIVASGRHDALLRDSADYRRLFELQHLGSDR